jgi:PAS domain S-box-containing protein
MDGIAINQLFLLVLQCIIVGTLLLFLFKLRFIFGLSLLFIALGVFQYMQTFLAAALYLEIIPGIFVSPGSMVMFTGSLFAILLIYIREDALEARKVIYAMLAANIVLAVLHLIFSWSITAQNVINVYNLPIDYFTLNSRVILAGTIVLFLDAFIIIFVYETMAKYIKPLFWRILITMSIVVVIDSVFYSITAFAGTDQFSNILISGMIAKLIAVVIYAIIFTIYLSFFDKGSIQLGKTELAFNDIFQTLTYRQKYEKVSLESEIKSNELQQSEIKFKILFETMTQGVIYQNNAGEIIDANPAAQRILGLTLDEMQGKTSMNPEWKAIHEDGSDFPGDSHASMMALKTGKVVNNIIMGVFNPRIKDYTWINVDAIPQFRNGEKKPYQVYTIFNDITIERKTQQKLNELYIKYQNIIYTTNIAIAELSAEGTYTFVNPAWEEMFGYSSSEVLGNTTQLVLDPAETEHSLFDKLLKGQITDYQQEKKYKNKNGKLIWCDLYVAANHDVEGNLKSIVSVKINITNKKEFEEKIIEKERITRDALEQVAHNEFLLNQTGQLAKVGGWELDLETMIPFFTKETFDIYELPYGTPPKIEDVINFYAPEARPLIQDAIVNHSNYDLEVPFITANGTDKWVRTIGHIQVENNKALKLFGAIQDITELKASENRFKSIVEEAPDPIFIQTNKRFAYLNHHALKLFGVKNENELLGKLVLDYFHPDFHQAALERIKMLNEDKSLVHEPFEQILIQIDGHQKWVETKGSPITYKGESGGLVFVRDIEYRKKAEKQLLEYQEQIETAQQIANLGYWELDITTNKLFWSEIIYEIFGIAKNEFESNYENFMRFVHPEDREMMQIAQDETLAGLKKLNLEHRIVRPNGEIIHVHEMGELIYDKKGKAIKLSGTIMDITKRVEKEIEILQYQKSLQSLTIDLTLVEEKQRKQIAENIHDNLSQSLVISKMKLNDLQKQIPTIENKERLKVVINHISEALENSRKITYDLSPPVLYELGLIEAIYWLAEKIETENQLKIEFNTDLNHIDLPEYRLILTYRVIQEVLNNVIKHARATLININFNKVADGFQIIIKDNGIGFSKSKLKVRKDLNSGFGLFTVKERIENLQGSLTIKTKLNLGTEIKLFIPLDEYIFSRWK